MPDITNIPPPSTGSGSDVNGKAGVSSAKNSDTDDKEQKTQPDAVSFLDSLQQRLAALSEQGDATKAAAEDGNTLPLNDEAATLFPLIAEQPAIVENAISAENSDTDALKQARRPAGDAVANRTAVSVDADTDAVVSDSATAAPAKPKLAETDSLFASRMQHLAADQPGVMATDRHALEMLMAGGRSPAADSLNALRSPSPMNSTAVDAAASITGQPVVSENMGHPEWGQGLGRQMLWMVNQNMRSAEMRLNPANLGPIEVRIEMDDDRVSVAFNSRHAVVREAIELAIPRLREMFDANGMNLTHTDVSHQSFAEQHNSAFSGDNNRQQQSFAANLPALDDIRIVQPEPGLHPLNDGLVDCYI
jgi:flagellar hook-length control protein FliK